MVPKLEGENTRLKLSATGYLRKDLRIFDHDGFIYIPVVESPGTGYSVLEQDFEEIEPVVGYKDLVDLPEEGSGHQGRQVTNWHNNFPC